MGTGEGMSEGLGEEIVEEWADIVRDFGVGSDSSEGQAFEASVEVPVGFHLGKKSSIASILSVGSEESLVGWVCSSGRVERERGSERGLPLVEQVAGVSGMVRRR